MKKWFEFAFYLFPIRLILLNFRTNIILMLLWGALFGMVSGHLGAYLGFQYLFLDAEYLGTVNFGGYFLIGIGFGVFALAWNTTTYILNSNRFPFLASLSRPYGKFSFNNALIPLLFVLYYVYRIVQFQWYNSNGFVPGQQILLYCLGFLSGLLVVLCGAMVYFYMTNQDIISYGKSHRLKISKVLRTIVVKRREREMQLIKNNPYQDAWRVDHFFTETFNIRLVRDVRHYNFKLLERVFRQNHANALIIQSFSIVALILMGALVEYPYFRIPTAASILILFSIITTIVGAVTYWLQEWRTLFLIGFIIIVNQLMTGGWFSYINYAYGLNYEREPAPYSYAVLDSICNPQQYAADMDSTLVILENWRDKFDRNRLLRKPKMVFICASGGGLRAGVWTMQVMRELHKQLGDDIMEHTVLMTGSSGGMFGLSYFRELYHLKQKGEPIDLQDLTYLKNMSKDLANAMSFTFLVNDIFIPWVNREVNGYTYKQDRGYILEQQFIENTGNILDVNLEYYREPEKQSIVPMMFFSPVIINDSRFLMISPHRISYMMRSPFIMGSSYQDAAEIDGVDFGALFKDHDAYNMRLLSAVRMSATFPLILPSVSIPTKPRLEVMDAGFRDNYGIESAARFITTFRRWIRENTSGVVIIQVRGHPKMSEIKESAGKSFLDVVLDPLSNIFSLDDLQDFHHDKYMGYIKSKLGYKVDIVNFMYRESKIEHRASLSFHLTHREKNDILSAIYLEENKKNMERLKEIIK